MSDFASISVAPGKEELWLDYVNKNQNGFGYGIMDFAARWASLVEDELSKGHSFGSVVQEMANAADTQSITGAMYNAAVYTLVQTWVWGEELRQWYNREVQGGEDTQKVNDIPGALLNPTIITVKYP